VFEPPAVARLPTAHNTSRNGRMRNDLRAVRFRTLGAG
jgi:hypothetical protein